MRRAPVVVASAEHCGTHFAAWLIAHMIGRAPAWVVPSHPDTLKKPDVGVLVTHVYPDGFRGHSDALIDALVVHSRLQVVVPIRHPYRAFISKRERPGDPLISHDLARVYTKIANWRDNPRVHYLKIDCSEADRPHIAGDLARFLAVPCSDWGWEPRNQTPDDQKSQLRADFEAGEDMSAVFATENTELDAIWPWLNTLGYHR